MGRDKGGDLSRGQTGGQCHTELVPVVPSVTANQRKVSGVRYEESAVKWLHTYKRYQGGFREGLPQ